MTATRVLKLGGSLLTLEDWPTRLRQWLSTQPTARNLLLVGGGEIIDAVRKLDAIHALSPSFVHWLCIDLLESSSRIAESLLPEFAVLHERSELNEHQQKCDGRLLNSNAIVRTSAFYKREAADPRLPQDWQCTSDSLAALLADQVNACELVLLKSTAPPSTASTADDLATNGVVDLAFPLIVNPECRLRVVNLRTVGILWADCHWRL